jgi:hypothetical protein
MPASSGPHPGRHATTVAAASGAYSARRALVGGDDRDGQGDTCRSRGNFDHARRA